MGPLASIEQSGPYGAFELSSLVLRPEDALPSAPFIGVSSELLLPEKRAGAESAFTSAFSSVPFGQVPPDPWVTFTPGATYVASSAYWFESNSVARTYLASVRASLALGAEERQRGPDGSWLVFHPEYEHAQFARPVPVAAAGWANSNVAMVVLYLGADSSVDALTLAQWLQDRVLDEWAARPGPK